MGGFRRSRDWRLGRGEILVSNLQSPNPLIALSLLLATILRFHHLDASSLWNDEGNSWAMLARSFGEIAAAAAADIHPPGYYWLLKAWSLIFGDGAAAMRGLSAMLGVLLVALTVAIARRVVRGQRAWRWFPALAALLASLNPFQIYYSQETRMYMLLAVETAGLFWALLWIVEIGGVEDSLTRTISNLQSPNRLIPQSLFLCFGVAGLWTHYSFPIVLAAAGLAFVIWWIISLRRAASHPTPVRPRLRRAQSSRSRRSLAPLLQFLTLNLLILLAFLPWLPTAIDRVLNWPKGGVAVGLVEGLALTLRALLFGPLRTVPDPLWPWLVVAGVLPVIGLIALRRFAFAALMLGLWLLLPVTMMFGLGLFSDAFLKFLLVASPAWSLLAAATPWIAPSRRIAHVLLFVSVIGFAVGAAWASLPAYYNDAYTRDNYQDVARYLAAVGDPTTDLVILDAPGQREVWRYYDPGLPVLALPDQRPPVAAAVETQLAAATADKRRVFALLWATDEADPERLVERWLDANAFKTMESWQGNLRFATYTLTSDLEQTAITPVRWENGMILYKVQQPHPAPQRVAPGEAAMIQLSWVTERALTQRYKVSVQLLDERNQVIAQHDSEPGGGAHPTDRWQIGEEVLDNHGIAIPFGAPPGLYRMIVVLYDAETGERVRQFGQDTLALGAVVVERAEQAPPLEVVPMQHRLGLTLDPVRLVGYDAYRRGYAHAPETPIQPGDTVHFTLYWQAPETLPEEWPADLSLTLRLGDQTINAPLAGGAYPTAAWQAGELVRGEFDLVYAGGDPRPVLTVAGTTETLRPLSVAQ
jgi:mannosyltransferase